MAADQVLDPAYRKYIIDEINGEENRQRKEESFIRSEYYNGRQQQYILDALAKEFTAKTVCEMRTITSISLTNRIVDELAAVYSDTPDRSFSGVDNEQIDEQIENLYQLSAANVAMKRANKMLKLHKQCALQTVPKNGVVKIRLLQPHQYDVINDPDSPEDAAVYVINTFDRSLTQASTNLQSRSSPRPSFADNHNQKIADQDDYKKSLQRLVWWTAQFNFITDGHGNVVSDPNAIDNPIGVLPFIDVHEDKEFEFWVRCGCPIVDFDRDFGKLLSDTANISRLQGYAQAIIYAETIPENLVVGPNHILRIPLNPDSEKDPRFEFVSPSPDLTASLSLLENYLRFFLASQNLQPGEVGGGETKSYSSGLERMLAMIEKFDASRDDFDRFQHVEMQLFDQLRMWSNALQGTDALVPELQFGTIPDDVELTVNFAKPEAIQTKSEKLDAAVKQMEQGLMSRAEAIAELRGVDIERAIEILKEIDGELLLNSNTSQLLGQQNGASDELVSGEDQIAEDTGGSDKSVRYIRRYRGPNGDWVYVYPEDITE